MVSCKDENGVVVLNWKYTRDVRLLSTKHAPIIVPVHPRIAENEPPIETQEI